MFRRIINFLKGRRESSPDYNKLSHANDDVVVRRKGNPDYIQLADDAESTMQAAIERAISEVEIFIEALTHSSISQSGFSVKKPFPYTTETGETGYEHIWLSDVVYRDGVFIGSVGNEPVDASGIRLNDEATVEKTEISDWMYIDDGVLVGGYTLRVLRDRMSLLERKEMDDMLPFRIE